MKRVLTLCLLASLALGATAQTDAVLSGLEWVPQHANLRPHSRPLGRAVVMLPGVDLAWNTNWLQPAQWLETSDAGTTVSAAAMLAGLHEANRCGVQAQVDVIGMGVSLGKSRKHYFSFSVFERAGAMLSLPADLIRLPFVGNAGFDDGQMDAQTLTAEALHYRSFSLGWQAHFHPQWSAGLRVQRLQGFEFARLQNAGLTWATDPETWEWTIDVGAELQTAGVAALWDTVSGNAALERGTRAYLTAPGNPGWAVDAGLAFLPNDQWTVEASVADLGRIRWNTDPWSAHWQAKTMTFDGIAVGAWALDPTAFEDSITAWGEAQAHWAEQAMQPEENTAAFTASLPVRWNVRAERQVGARLRGHVALREGQTSAVSATAGATLSLGHALQLTSVYQHGNGLRALGVGWATQLGPLQWYVAVDNLLAAQLVQLDLPDEQRLYLPWDARRVQARTGLNWVIGRKPKREPQIPTEYRAANSMCPGTQRTRVCPVY